MRYLLRAFFIVLMLVTLIRAETPEYWGRSIIIERNSSDDIHEVDLGEVDQRDILIGTLTVKNKSVDEVGTRASVMAIEGHQNPDGTFWPTAELQVQKEKGAEWTRVGTSGNESPLSQLKVYTGTTVFGLRINLNGFKAHLGTSKFGRILLKSGSEAIFSLDDLKPPSKETNK
jgi:hypothetical protein